LGLKSNIDRTAGEALSHLHPATHAEFAIAARSPHGGSAQGENDASKLPWIAGAGAVNFYAEVGFSWVEINV
jgi:hypothetical protein